MSEVRSAIPRVKLEGGSWAGADCGLYCFEATIDGEKAELRVTEDVAFDLLGAWTMSHTKCLEILRLHRADLAKNLERKLLTLGFTDNGNLHFLDLGDIERTHPVERDRERADWSEYTANSGG